MKLNIKKAFSSRSDRVKGIDFHPTQPWLLSTLYSGKAEIWNYETQQLVRSINITDVPVRAGRFIARQNWIVVGCDDFKIKVYNHNTGEKVADFEAHPDYIRCVAVHPTLPYILTSSDDSAIKLWNWEKNWALEQTFEGHEHFVMWVEFNPKDPNTFASACLDRTVKIWSLGNADPNFSINTHETEGVNYVNYYPQQDKPYLLTCSDDRTIKVWDYQTKSCVATLEGHLTNVSYAIFHPTLPIIISGSEDSTLKIWNSTTYKLEKTLNLGLERSWCISAHPAGKRNYVAAGCDDGFSLLSMGNDDPIFSMDPVGKLVWCGGKIGTSASDVFTSLIKPVDEEQAETLEDGSLVPLQVKELGNVDVYPTAIKHSPNGRNVAVLGDGEYIIYTSLAWRNKAFGKCQDFAWAPDSNSYVILDQQGGLQLFNNFKSIKVLDVEITDSIEKLFTGPFLGVKTVDGFTSLFDWETGSLVRRIDVDADQIVWSANEELILISTQASNDTEAENTAGYVLEFNKEMYDESLSNGNVSEEGVEDCLDVLYEFNDVVRSGKWVGDVFIYTSHSDKLNYFVGGKSYTLAHFDKPSYVIGYLPKDSRIYVTDRDMTVTSYSISVAVLEFQTLVLRGEIDAAFEEILPNVSGKDNLMKISRFLEAQELYQEAFDVAPDADQKFFLALKLGYLEQAFELLSKDESESKWRTLGDAALKKFNFKLAIEGYSKAHDLESLFLIYSSFNMKEKLIELGKLAEEDGKFNVAFNAYWSAGAISSIQSLLASVGRVPEAAIFGYTYGSDVERFVEAWKQKLNAEGKQKLADRIIVPQIKKTENLIDLEQEETPVKTVEEQQVQASEVSHQEEEEEEEEEKTRRAARGERY
ncbi:hypothetical protein ACO0QE_003588 [Hanseniaspora vineae]